IFGRLGTSNVQAAIDLVAAARADPDFWPMPRWPTLTPPGAERLRLYFHDCVLSVAFSPDGAHVVAASSDLTARIYDVRSGAELCCLRGHEARVLSAAYSPKDARIVTASADRTARICDGLAGEQVISLRGHRDWVRSAVFSPD